MKDEGQSEVGEVRGTTSTRTDRARSAYRPALTVPSWQWCRRANSTGPRLDSGMAVKEDEGVEGRGRCWEGG